MSQLESLSIDSRVSAADRIFLEQHYRITTTADWSLTCIDGVYQLSYMAQNLSLKLDFREGNYQHRNSNPGKEPLLKAVKIKQKLPTTLIDATPGVLKDSFMLADRGVDIIAIERNALMFVMVKQALSCLHEPISIDYRFGDATQALTKLSSEVIYLDPMYPPKKKSAQVKKDMQVLHQIVGNDSDADELLHAARKTHSRIVVKRPSYAEPLANINPSFVSKTGATRFDVYLALNPKIND